MKKLLLFLVVLITSINIVNGQDKKSILIFGDSITAGYGVEPQQAFPAILQNKIDELSLNYDVINGGLSGETSAGGLRRIDWVLQRKIDIMILELGGNDGLRGIDLSSTKQNLEQIIEKARAKYPDIEILIAGMQVPPNLGTDYTKEFETLYPALAKENNATLIPMILDSVGGKAELMQSDQIHPNVEGHKMVAEEVWGVLYPLLEDR